jgi:hypothetical protein
VTGCLPISRRIDQTMTISDDWEGCGQSLLILMRGNAILASSTSEDGCKGTNRGVLRLIGRMP